MGNAIVENTTASIGIYELKYFLLSFGQRGGRLGNSYLLLLGWYKLLLWHNLLWLWHRLLWLIYHGLILSPQAPSIADPALSKERLLRIDILLGLGRSACLKAGRGRICVVSSAAHQQYCTIGRRLHGCGVPHTIWRCVNELLMLWVYGYLDVLLWHIGI